MKLGHYKWTFVSLNSPKTPPVSPLVWSLTNSFDPKAIPLLRRIVSDPSYEVMSDSTLEDLEELFERRILWHSGQTPSVLNELALWSVGLLIDGNFDRVRRLWSTYIKGLLDKKLKLPDLSAALRRSDETAIQDWLRKESQRLKNIGPRERRIARGIELYLKVLEDGRIQALVSLYI